ncbi:hypothetical protein PRUPE_2G018800 [Prunus persica]|uniref:Uncharacterized protein n=1 Tax=Prunus persica TaxID=3760 RepID=A0A251QAR5_PRUPE|nr:hypothetical protein PRUPE_2G018800 [Prunus persica]
MIVIAIGSWLIVSWCDFFYHPKLEVLSLLVVWEHRDVKMNMHFGFPLSDAGVAIFILLISFYSTRDVQGVTEAEKFSDSYLLWLMSW